MTARHRLPNRRPLVTQQIAVAGWPALVASVGFDHDGRVREIFLRALKPDSQIDRFVDDAAVAISLALQWGASAASLAAAVSRRRADPQTPLGAALDLAATLDADEASS